MHNNGSKYIYIKDSMGEVLGVITNIDKDSPSPEDTVFLKIIAQRTNDNKEWNKESRDVDIAVRLQKTEDFKMFDDHEKFCEDFFDAIL